MGKLRRAAAGIALPASIAGIAYAAAAIGRLRAFRAMRSRRELRSGQPPITVLKPLHGAEPQLYENLCSFCDQQYPEFQVIFGVADPGDPAAEIARRAIERFAGKDISLCEGTATAGSVNPKVANLLGMIGAAKHDLLAIADSDIRVGPTYLAELAATFADSRTGAATCLYGGMPRDGIVSQLGAMHVNDQFAPSVLVAMEIEPLTYCFGATMAVRRTVLREIGGLESLAGHLGDDYLLGKLVSDAGHAVALCPYVARTTVCETDFRALWQRELRWARTIRAARPAGYVGSILTYGLPLAAAYAFLSRTTFAGGAVLALAGALRLALHEDGRKTFAPANRPTPWLIPLRDAFGVAIWCASFFGDRVRWRAAQYGVHRGGRLKS